MPTKVTSSKKSAGLLLYRFSAGIPEVLLVHPGGPFWAKKDSGAWSIPKGEFDEGEAALAAAKREFKEETGIEVEGNFIELLPVKQKGGKMVYAWALEKEMDAGNIQSNSFDMEWPPKSGIKKSFPEIDKAAWFNFNEAKVKILPAQLSLIDELEIKLADTN